MYRYLQEANDKSVPVKPIPEMWIPVKKTTVIHSKAINSFDICLIFFHSLKWPFEAYDSVDCQKESTNSYFRNKA